ncbi:MAG: hypothetical protein IH985_01505 [Planctomycetes bacterium]|nr:hypothetical protein [Planctomycetota bacterium]
MTAIILLVGVIIAVSILATIPRLPSVGTRTAAAIAAVLVLGLAVFASSYRHVGENEVGVVVREALGPGLAPGKIIATSGEKGVQADTLAPGWHAGLWPVIFKMETTPIIEIEEGNVGLITAADGKPLPPGFIYAPEWAEEDFGRMIGDATYFLGPGGGHKGPQASVLTPGKHRFNPQLFKVTIVKATNIEKATVGVVKSNVGELPAEGAAPDAIVDRGSPGIWRQPLLPSQYYMNTNALEVTMISTAKRTVRYTKAASQRRGIEPGTEEREITVRSSDGFTFPVDVRVEYEVTPKDASLVVANFGSDGQELSERLNSAVRAIFRNNAEGVKALDYVQQRSLQESQSLALLVTEMAKVGITVTAVRIGDVGDEETLGELLKTQTDREIALQEQETFKEQQRAAEQKKELARTQQEAEEEKRLATANYEVQIAEQDRERVIIQAGAEAEAIKLRAAAQADAYKLIAEQIGMSNAALVELLKIIGERGINITPRVMVISNGGSSGDDAEMTALIGTMLDSMISRQEPDGKNTP